MNEVYTNSAGRRNIVQPEVLMLSLHGRPAAAAVFIPGLKEVITQTNIELNPDYISN